MEPLLSMGKTGPRLKPEVLGVHIAAIVQFCDHRVGKALPAEVAHGTAACDFAGKPAAFDPKRNFLVGRPNRQKIEPKKRRQPLFTIEVVDVFLLQVPLKEEEGFWMKDLLQKSNKSSKTLVAPAHPFGVFLGVNMIFLDLLLWFL